MGIMRRFAISVIVLSGALFGFVVGGVVAIELLASGLIHAGSSSSDLFATDTLGREFEILIGCAIGSLLAGWWALLLTRRYTGSS
jgi:hypothetical protein